MTGVRMSRLFTDAYPVWGFTVLAVALMIALAMWAIVPLFRSKPRPAPPPIRPSDLVPIPGWMHEAIHHDLEAAREQVYKVQRRILTWRHALSSEGHHGHIRAKILPLWDEGGFPDGYEVQVVNTSQKNTRGTDIVLTSGLTYDTWDEAADAGRAMVTAFRFVRWWGVTFQDLNP